MRMLLALIVLMVPVNAFALSVKDFSAKPGADQSEYVVTFVEKMTNDIAATNPQMAQAIRKWFSDKADDKPGSEGAWKLYLEIGAIEALAKEGKLDTSKIQIEGVITKVIMRKFAPEQARK